MQKKIKNARVSTVIFDESTVISVRDHIKLGVLLRASYRVCVGCWLWAWQIYVGLQTCIGESFGLFCQSDLIIGRVRDHSSITSAKRWVVMAIFAYL